MTVGDSFKQLTALLVKGQAQKHFYAPVPADHVLDDDFDKTTFEHERSYFKLRVSEIFLQNRRQLWRDFLPLCLVVADYHYAGEGRSLPFIVSHERLREALNKARAGNAPIELLNTTVVGPVPFVAGDLGLFTALFRTQERDLVDILFEVLGGLGNAVGIKALVDQLPMAELAYDGLKRLLKMQSVEFRFGTRDEFRVGAGAGKLLRGSYLVFTNAPENDLKEARLWVRGGRLHVGDTKGAVRPLREHDYCLIAIEHHPNREHYGDLPFHRLWEDIPKMIWEDQVERAEKLAWPALGKAIVTSPDLTKEDKASALGAYKTMFEAEIGLFSGSRQESGDRGNEGGGATRGEGAAGKGGIRRLRDSALRVESDEPEVASVLLTLADHLQKKHEALPSGAVPRQPVDTSSESWRRMFDNELNELRIRLQKIPARPEPERFYEALVADTFRSQ